MHKQKVKSALMALAIGVTSFQSMYSAPHDDFRSMSRQARRVACTRAAREDKMVAETPAFVPVSGGVTVYGKGLLATLMVVSLLTAPVQADLLATIGQITEQCKGKPFFEHAPQPARPAVVPSFTVPKSTPFIPAVQPAPHYQAPAPVFQQPLPPVAQLPNLPEHAYVASGHLPQPGGPLGGVNLDKMYKTGEVEMCPGKGCRK